MIRFSTFLSITLLLLSAMVVLGKGAAIASAQDANQVHPIVGIWIADTDSEITENTDSVFIFSPDGAYTELHPDGEVLIGRWESTAKTTATLTIVSTMMNDDESSAGVFIIRASVEVAADLATFSANYTFEIVNPDGTSAGQVGPGLVEAPGEPEDLFAMFEGDDEATPTP